MGTARSSETLSLNTWTHIAVIWESSTYKLYINGKEVSLSTPSGYGLITPVTRAIIGARTNAPTEEFSGLLDDVKIFNYALTQEQVQLEHNQGAVSFN